MRDRSLSPKPSFRNTRSRFFHKRQSNNDDKPPQSAAQNTGNYWKEKGNASFKKGDMSEAIVFYTKAIELNPGESVFFSNRAKCFKNKNQLQDALKDAEEACELDESNIKAHYLCGCILAQLGKKDMTKVKKAQNRLKKALRLCHTLKKQVFVDDISIRIYRLAKMAWLREEQEEYEMLQQQIQGLSFCLQNGTVSKEQFEKVNALKGKKMQKLKAKKEIPDHLCCRITLELMEQPVCTQAGFSYEKQAIEDHFRTNGMIEPITRKQILGKVYPNLALKTSIEEFLKDNPWAFEFSPNQNYLEIQF